MSVNIEELALDYKPSTKVGIAYGFELHVVDDSDIARGENGSSKPKQKRKASATV